MKNFYLFTITLTVVLLVSGFTYYFLAPQNWGAGEFVLHFHLWVGVLFSFYLIYAIPMHIKETKKRASSAVFIKLSYAMMIFFGITLISGLAHFIPYISYNFSPIYYQFETYDAISTIHLISASVLTLLFALHLSIKHKENK